MIYCHENKELLWAVTCHIRLQNTLFGQKSSLQNGPIISSTTDVRHIEMGLGYNGK